MSLARQFAKPTPVTTNVTPRNQPASAKQPVTVVMVTRAEHDKVVAEVEKLRGEIAELREMIISLPWFTAAATVEPKPSKRDRASYMREYRKRRKQP